MSFLSCWPCPEGWRPFTRTLPERNVRNWLPRQAPPLHIRINSAAFYWLNYRGMVEVEGLAVSTAHLNENGGPSERCAPLSRLRNECFAAKAYRPKLDRTTGLARALHARPIGLRLRRPGRAAALPHLRSLGPKPSALAVTLHPENGSGSGSRAHDNVAYETRRITRPSRQKSRRRSGVRYGNGWNCTSTCSSSASRADSLHYIPAVKLARTAGNAPASGRFGDGCLACRPRPYWRWWESHPHGSACRAGALLVGHIP